MAIYPVILSGGSGSRLWPLSRAAMPKQLLPLVSDLSLLQETALRLSRLPDAAPPLLICNDDHRFLVAEQLRSANMKPQSIVLEPVARNTAPAVAVAALMLMATDPDAVLIVAPSDHVIADEAAFRAAIAPACVAARQGAIVTFGIHPTHPATGYGYIEQGDAIEGANGCHRIARFLEKPDHDTAQRLATSGRHHWNSGVFVFTAAACVRDMQRLQPVLLSACARALENAQTDMAFTRLDAAAFAEVPPISFDYAVMEHTRHGAVIPVDMGWSDVGSWSALWDVHAKDSQDNVIRGDVIAHDTSGTMVNAQDRMVATVGVRDLVIVETKDAVLVAHKSAAQDVQKIVKQLQADKRTEHLQHRRTYRPWGYYESVDEGERFQVKRLMVNPGAKLSLQMHHHRAEHWIVVKGTARVWRGDDIALLSENQSTYIPIGTPHRLENPGKVPLHIIEVQSGCYLGEDDIVRYDDIYNRVAENAVAAPVRAGYSVAASAASAPADALVN